MAMTMMQTLSVVLFLLLTVVVASGNEDSNNAASGYSPRDLLQHILSMDPKTVTMKEENNYNYNKNHPRNSYKEEEDHTNNNMNGNGNTQSHYLRNNNNNNQQQHQQQEQAVLLRLGSSSHEMPSMMIRQQETDNHNNNVEQQQVTAITSTTPITNSWPPPWMLRRVADAQQRLVVVAVSAGDVDFADNYAQSLERLHVTNYVFVPLDRAAYKTLRAAYPDHTLPLQFPGMVSSMEEENEEERQQQNNHNDNTASRPSLLRAFLEQGYTVFYNDIDMVWKQNAWNELEKRNNHKQQAHANAPHMLNENYTAMLWRDGTVKVSSCLMYLTPVPSSFQMLDQWAMEIAIDAYNPDDQPAFQAAIQKLEIYAGYDVNEPPPTTSTSNNPLVAVWPNDKQFRFGRHYFTDSPKEDRRHVVIIHNDWIIGKHQKMQRLIELDLWHPSGLIPSESA
jgi:hypothetical protein